MRRRLTGLAAIVVVVVAALWIVGRVEGVGPFSPQHWVNVRTGTVAGLGYEDRHRPFESSDGCGAGSYTSSISWQRGWYLQAYTGPNEMTGGYSADATLPQDAAFTGWQRSDRQLWVSLLESLDPGVYRDLYVVDKGSRNVERWPLATWGCQ